MSNNRKDYFNLERMQSILESDLIAVPVGMTKEQMKEFIKDSVTIDEVIVRIQASLESGERIKLPKGLSREGRRQFIINNRGEIE